MKLKVKRRYVVVFLSLLTLSVVMINTYSPLPCEQKCLLSQGPHHNLPIETEARNSKHLAPNIHRGKKKALEKHTLGIDQHPHIISKLHENVHFFTRRHVNRLLVKPKQGSYQVNSSQTNMAHAQKMLSKQPGNGNGSKYASDLVPKHDQTVPPSARRHSLHPDIKLCKHKCTPDGPEPAVPKSRASVRLSTEIKWTSKGARTYETRAEFPEKRQHHSMDENNRVSGEGAEGRDFTASWCEALHDQHLNALWDQTRAESLPWFSKDDVQKMGLLSKGTVLSKARIPGHGQVLQVGLAEHTSPLNGDHDRLCQTGQCALIKRHNDWFEVLAFHLDRVLGLNRSLPAVLRTFHSDLLPYKYTRGSGRPVVWWDPDIQHLADDNNDQNSFSLIWPQYQDLLKARCGIEVPLNSSVCIGVHHSEWGRLALFDFLLQVNDRLDRYCCGFQPDPADTCVENLLNVKCAHPKDLTLVHILVRRTDPSRLVFIDNAGRPHHPQDNLNFRLIEGIDVFPERAMSVLRSGCLERLLLRSISVDKELWETQGGAAGLRATIQTLQHRAGILLQHMQNKRVNTDL